MKFNSYVKQIIVLALPLLLGALLSVSVLTGFALAQPAAQGDGQTYWLVLDGAKPVDEVLPPLQQILADLQSAGHITSFDPTPQASAPNAAQAVKVIAAPGQAGLLGSLPGVLDAIDALPPAPPDDVTVLATTIITGLVTEVVSPTNPIDLSLDPAAISAYDAVTYLFLNSTTTGPDGLYSLTVTPFYDQAKLRFDGTSGVNASLTWTGYGDEWYNDKFSFNTATPISATGGTVTNINAQLLRNDAALTGTVRLVPANTPLAGVRLRIFQVAGANSFPFFGSTDSDSNGVFTFTNLISGAYKLEADNNTNTPEIAREFYDDAANVASGDSINLSSGATGTVVFDVGATAVITGRVTNAGTGAPLQFVNVSLLDEGTGDLIQSAGTDVNGDYRLSGFGSGSYVVQFFLFGFNNEFYNDKSSFALADLVTATAGTTLTNINAGLTPSIGVAITGTVTSAAGAAMPNVNVTLYQQVGDEFLSLGVTATDLSGNYQFSDVTNGVYKVVVGQDDSNPPINDDDIIPHAVEWFNNGNVISTATRITITNGISQTGQNVQLALGSCLAGRIVDASSGLGLNNQEFEVLQAENNDEVIDVLAGNGGPLFWTSSPQTDNEGQGDFRVCGLPTGTFTVDCGAFTDDPAEQVSGAITAPGQVVDVGVCELNATGVYLPLVIK